MWFFHNNIVLSVIAITLKFSEISKPEKEDKLLTFKND